MGRRSIHLKSVINLSTDTVIDTIAVANSPDNIFISPVAHESVASRQTGPHLVAL
jgi:hypothetical protein